jgi:hypothetical protein
MSRPKAPARLLYNDDGKTLDEIVFDGYVHVEQMDDDHYWMGVGESHFDFYAEPFIETDEDGYSVVKVRIQLVVGDLARGDFPEIERHKTADEVRRDGYEPATVPMVAA